MAFLKVTVLSLPAHIPSQTIHTCAQTRRIHGVFFRLAFLKVTISSLPAYIPSQTVYPKWRLCEVDFSYFMSRLRSPSVSICPTSDRFKSVQGEGEIVVLSSISVTVLCQSIFTSSQKRQINGVSCLLCVEV